MRGNRWERQCALVRKGVSEDDSLVAFWRRTHFTSAAHEQLARRSDPFQQPLQKSDKRGRRGGCDDPNTNQWKWHILVRHGLRRHRPSCSPTHTCLYPPPRCPRRRCVPTWRVHALELRVLNLGEQFFPCARGVKLMRWRRNRRARARARTATDWLLIRNYGNAHYIPYSHAYTYARSRVLFHCLACLSFVSSSRMILCSIFFSSIPFFVLFSFVLFFFLVPYNISLINFFYISSFSLIFYFLWVLLFFILPSSFLFFSSFIFSIPFS